MGEEATRMWLRERLESRAQKLVAIAAGITTVIGVPLAINALIDTFWPDDSTAVARSATLTVKPEKIGLTWDQFMREYPGEAHRKPYSRPQLGTHGIVLSVQITATGLADKTSTLRWKVFNTSGAVGNFDPPPWVPRSREFRPSTSPAHVTVHIWLPPPPEALDEEIVRFTVLDDRDEELLSKDSPKLRVEPA